MGGDAAEEEAVQSDEGRFGQGQTEAVLASKAAYWIDAIKGRGGVAFADIYGNDVKGCSVNVKEIALMTKCRKNL